VKEILMPEDKHSKALDLTDEALEKIVAGDEKAADQLLKHSAIPSFFLLRFQYIINGGQYGGISHELKRHARLPAAQRTL
jgi:hypothetical protein